MKELLINGKRIDLGEDSKIGVTFQANNIGELQNRQGTLTNTFLIPNTQNNALNLEHSNLTTSASLLPYQKLKATFKDGGIEIITEGSAFITSSTNSNYSIEIVGGNIDLSIELGDSTVGDLYEDDTVYNWTLDNIVDSRNLDLYFIYPVVDFRSDIDTFFTVPTVNAQALLPCCVVSKMFDRLETFTGYTFTGSYFQSDDHLKMILTPDNFAVNPLYISQEETKASLTLFTYPSGVTAPRELESIFIPEDSGSQIGQCFPIQNVFDADFLSNNYAPSITHIGRLSFTSQYNAIWYAVGSFSGTDFNQQRTFVITTQIKRFSDGAVLAEITSDVISSQTQAGAFVSDDDYIVSVQTDEIQLDAGDIYFCVYKITIEAFDNTNSVFTMYENSSIFKHIPTSQIAFGTPIRFRDIFRMKVKDVLKDILNLRGLIIQTNSYTKEVSFNFFEDLTKNKAIAKNWSDKVTSKEYRLTYQFGNYAQKNYARFKSDKEVTEFLGDEFFNVNNENLDKEKTVIQLNHSATEQENRYLGYNIPSIKAINSATLWQKPTYRILNTEIQNTSFDINFTDGTSSINLSNNIPFARFIGFDILIPQYYETLVSILDETKFIVLNVNLTAIEIQELDFSIPIYLKLIDRNIDGYFYINKIENYKGGATRCEFIRL
jgi:hypothetical protein